jgi:CubicO group peptidase (beta-lactamase class C family)
MSTEIAAEAVLAKPDGVIPLHLFLAKVAKVLCSAVFLSGRDIEEARKNSAFHVLHIHHLEQVLLGLFDVSVDRVAKTVIVSLTLDEETVPRIVAGYRAYYHDFSADWAAESERLLGLRQVSRTARFVGDQGSIILPRDGGPLRFEPVLVRTTLPDGATQAWPMGDRLDDPAATGSAAPSRVAEAVDEAFAELAATTAAVVVLHRGEIVGERYRDGIGMHTQLESWSMGKSITATLVGVLVQQGLLTIDEPAPIPEWQQPGDPRAAITVRDLLQMSGGLLFSGQDDPRDQWRLGVPDHLYIYCETLDVFAFSINRPAQHPPGRVGRYRNCDPLALGYIVKRIVTEKLGQNYLRWPQAALFDRIGIRRQVLETDLYGNFILTGFDYGTARNWARLGLLYLQDGMWNGARVLPQGWTKFVSSPAPGWHEPRYGGQFWLNGTGEFDLPRDAYYMAGAGEQRVFIVPSLDLVVVRLGHRAGDTAARTSINAMLRKLVQTVAS